MELTNLKPPPSKIKEHYEKKIFYNFPKKFFLTLVDEC